MEIIIFLSLGISLQLVLIIHLFICLWISIGVIETIVYKDKHKWKKKELDTTEIYSYIATVSEQQS